VVGKIFVFYFHVFRVPHREGQKVVLEVSAEETCPAADIGDCTVEDEFTFQQGSCRGSRIVVLWQFVAPDGQSYPMFFALERAVVAETNAIRHCLVSRYFRLVDEVDCVCGYNPPIDALC
jgi:hypothetical protein